MPRCILFSQGTAKTVKTAAHYFVILSDFVWDTQNVFSRFLLTTEKEFNELMSLSYEEESIG